MTIKYLDAKRLQGVSGDTKPTNVPTGCIFEETNTQLYYWWSGSAWEKATFTTATGGTIADDGDYRVHSFTTVGSATFSVTKVRPAPDNVMDILVVAGGGGGGCHTGGGAGAGGLLYQSGRTLTTGDITITVGVGGNGGTASSSGNAAGTNGGNSTFGPATAVGGGYGANGRNHSWPYNNAGCKPANQGGSGGGGGGLGCHLKASGTQGDSDSMTGYGNLGADGHSGGEYTGGGGGAGGSGYTYGQPSWPGEGGGVGKSYSITGSSVYYAGGGAGEHGDGGNGGGGDGSTGSGDQSASSANGGDANTGGGGGGLRGIAGAHVGVPGSIAGNGGSGIVIVRYKAY